MKTLSRGANAGNPSISREYYPALDGLRGLAFLLVFLVHYASLPWGWVGVEIFFVLSGFLITGILYDMRGSRHALKNFYVRRTLRIFPLYYFVLALGGLAAWMMHVRLSLGWLAWLGYAGNLLYLHSSPLHSAWWLATDADVQSSVTPWLVMKMGHFWSLCVEEQFYLLWPALLLLLRTRKQIVTMCLVLIVACPIARALVMMEVAHRGLHPALVYFLTPLRVDAFMYGALMAMVRRGHSVARFEQAAKYILAGGLALCLALLAPALLGVSKYPLYEYPSWEYTWGMMMADILSLCLLILSLDRTTWLHRALQWKVLAGIGRISYGAYVFHLLFLTEVTHLIIVLPIAHKLLPTVCLGLGLTLGLAWLSFRYVESPFLRLKSRWGSNRKEVEDVAALREPATT